MLRTVAVVLALGLIGSCPAPSSAYVYPGDTAPAFTKNELAGSPGMWSTGAPRSLANYSGKVVVLFLLGYS